MMRILFVLGMTAFLSGCLELQGNKTNLDGATAPAAASGDASARPHDGSEGIPGYAIKLKVQNIVVKKASGTNSDPTLFEVSAPKGTVSANSPLTSLRATVVQAPDADIQGAQQNGTVIKSVETSAIIPVASDGSIPKTIITSKYGDPVLVAVGPVSDAEKVSKSGEFTPSIFSTAYPGQFSSLFCQFELIIQSLENSVIQLASVFGGGGGKKAATATASGSPSPSPASSPWDSCSSTP